MWGLRGVGYTGGMRVLVLNHEFPPVGGGASPMAWQLCRRLAALGHEVDVVTMRYGDLPPFEQREGVRIHRTWALRRRADICHTHEMATYLLGAWPTVRRLLRQRRPQIIHCHFLLPAGPLAWRAGRVAHVPWVVTCHGSDVPGYNPERFGLDHKLLRPAWRALARRAALLISPSESLKRLILAQHPAARVQVIPNGIDLPDYAPVPKERRIVLCSRLLARKGFQYALEAIRTLELDWQLDVIGDGPFRAELERLAAGSKTPVAFSGWLDRDGPQLRRLYETGSIFIFPSEAENFPIVLLEAMAAGMAIIASSAGGCPEVVGEAALLVPPRDSPAIRRELQKLIASPDLRRNLAEAARRRVRQFAWPSVAEQYLRCYQQAVRESEHA